ncbi:MAG TPA: hypothetical protein PLY34_14135 [Ferruginibacter sp.]|nr:hypothetical protein [Ferruginibacter sp.]
MVKGLLLSCMLIFSLMIHAQVKPMIGTAKDDKAKLLLIKKGLPDIKKNLTRRVDDYSEDREARVLMGNEGPMFSEEDNVQTLTYDFSRSYFSGTTEEYQSYYRKLLGTIKEVFGDKYDSVEYKKEAKKWCVSFFEKGKKWESPTSIYVCCDWMLASIGPKISLSFFWTKPD